MAMTSSLGSELLRMRCQAQYRSLFGASLMTDALADHGILLH